MIRTSIDFEDLISGIERIIHNYPFRRIPFDPIHRGDTLRVMNDALINDLSRTDVINDLADIWIPKSGSASSEIYIINSFSSLLDQLGYPKDTKSAL